jgi:hypothetical protein
MTCSGVLGLTQPPGAAQDKRGRWPWEKSGRAVGEQWNPQYYPSLLQSSHLNSVRVDRVACNCHHVHRRVDVMTCCLPLHVFGRLTAWTEHALHLTGLGGVEAWGRHIQRESTATPSYRSNTMFGGLTSGLRYRETDCVSVSVGTHTDSCLYRECVSVRATA